MSQTQYSGRTSVFEGLAPLVNVLMVMSLYATFLLVWTRLNLHEPLSVIHNGRNLNIYQNGALFIVILRMKTPSP